LFARQERRSLVGDLVVRTVLCCELEVEDKDSVQLARKASEHNELLLTQVVKCIVGEVDDKGKRQQVDRTGRPNNSEIVGFFCFLDVIGTQGFALTNAY